VGGGKVQAILNFLSFFGVFQKTLRNLLYLINLTKLSYFFSILLALFSLTSYAEEIAHPGVQVEMLVRSTQDWNGSVADS